MVTRQLVSALFAILRPSLVVDYVNVDWYRIKYLCTTLIEKNVSIINIENYLYQMDIDL